MCKHALTRLPLISPWAALTSAFWVSDKATLVLCRVSATNYWTDLKVEISFFFILLFHSGETFPTISFKSPICEFKVLFWRCLRVDDTHCLELCVPSLYRCELKSSPWCIIQRGSFSFWAMFLFVLGSTGREILEDFNSPEPDGVTNNDQIHFFSFPPLIVSWILNFLFPPEWSERIRSDSRMRKEGAAFKDQVDCKYRLDKTQITITKTNTWDAALNSTCFSSYHEQWLRHTVGALKWNVGSLHADWD